VDAVLAITGRHWFRSIGEGPYRHWLPRMRHLDLAVERAHFPRVKGAFAPPGARRFVYVGHQKHYKNIPYLSALARAASGSRFSFVGFGPEIPGLERLGALDFGTAAGRARMAEHDFLVTVGNADANPTTILEAMSWGLVPVCTPQSGYDDEPGIVNLPLDDLAGALRIVEGLQACPAAELEARRAANDRRLDEHYGWDRFARDVVAVLSEEGRAPLAAEDPATARLLRRNARREPGSPWRWRNLRKLMSRNLRRRLAGGSPERLPRSPVPG
jgi:glycosyltransferase involved in cell wall biosynthesis